MKKDTSGILFCVYITIVGSQLNFSIKLFPYFILQLLLFCLSNYLINDVRKNGISFSYAHSDQFQPNKLVFQAHLLHLLELFLRLGSRINTARYRIIDGRFSKLIKFLIKTENDVFRDGCKNLF